MRQQRYPNDVLIFCQQRMNDCSVDLWKTSLIISAGLWNTSNEPPQGLSRQTLRSEFSHLCRRVRDRLFQKTGNL